jgi:hypothetical protein
MALGARFAGATDEEMNGRRQGRRTATVRQCGWLDVLADPAQGPATSPRTAAARFGPSRHFVLT